MRFSCNQQVLAKALNTVSKAVTSRTTIPILKGILLRINSDGTLTMAASDLDLSIEKTFKVNDCEEGETVVQAKLFGDIIRKLPDTDVMIEENDGNMQISCSNSQFNILTSQSDEFPKINVSGEGSDEILLDKELLKTMIKRTAYAASIDESRGVITGILVEIKDNILNMVALDGFRMAVTREEISNSGDKRIIIPAKILNEISKILAESNDDNENVTFSTNEKRAIFIIDDTKVVIRILEGEFVNYNAILPKESAIRVVLNKSDFLESLERASLLAKVGKNNLIRMEIGENLMEITSKSEEGNVKEEVIISRTGNGLTIGFNSKYLIDAVKAIDDEEIVMLFNTGVSPCLITPLEGNYYEYLILPVKISY